MRWIYLIKLNNENMLKRILRMLTGEYNQTKFRFNQIMFYVRCPFTIKFAKWEDETILKIGGKINPILENKISRVKKIISVDVSDKYINSKNIVDIQADAHSLPMINSESVDFIASSHTIEHLTNPLKALNEWRRILKTKGIFFLLFYLWVLMWQEPFGNLLYSFFIINPEVIS